MFPTHLNGCLRDASSRFPQDASELHRYGQLVCTCGCEQFDLVAGDKRTVFASCTKCDRRITVYDLALYPAAVKISGEETFAPLRSGRDQRAIFVMYEYGMPEPDMEADPNDITWCQILVETSTGEVDKVFDDETC